LYKQYPYLFIYLYICGIKEVVEALEEDPDFRKKLEESNATDIKVNKEIGVLFIQLQNYMQSYHVFVIRL
jgi:hypothetical protein